MINLKSISSRQRRHFSGELSFVSHPTFFQKEKEPFSNPFRFAFCFVECFEPRFEPRFDAITKHVSHQNSKPLDNFFRILFRFEIIRSFSSSWGFSIFDSKNVSFRKKKRKIKK